LPRSTTATARPCCARHTATNTPSVPPATTTSYVHTLLALLLLLLLLVVVVVAEGLSARGCRGCVLTKVGAGPAAAPVCVFEGVNKAATAAEATLQALSG
jgi:hypothetical protein